MISSNDLEQKVEILECYVYSLTTAILKLMAKVAPELSVEFHADVAERKNPVKFLTKQKKSDAALLAAYLANIEEA